MKNQTITVVIPMAGLGKRLRPHTWSKPKQLVSVAGETVLDHVLESLASLPNFEHIELVCIVGYLSEQIEEHIKKHYPHMKAHFVLQEQPLGQSHAIKLAQARLEGPMLMVFADTLIETDLSFLEDEPAEAIAWVKSVPDPRRFGVAVADEDGWVQRLVEKPSSLENKLVLVGCYYFNRSEDLLSAIDEQMRRDVQLKGEYFLVDAINIMLERGLKMRTQQVDVWLDAGTPEALLATNRYLLDRGRDNSQTATQREGVVVLPPVFIHPSAQIKQSVIGPYASIGASCQVENCLISESILEEGVQASGLNLRNSLVGSRASLIRQPDVIDVGDDTVLSL